MRVRVFGTPCENYVVNYYVRESVAEMRWVYTWCLGHWGNGRRAQLYRGIVYSGASGFPGCAASWGRRGGDVTFSGVDVCTVV